MAHTEVHAGVNENNALLRGQQIPQENTTPTQSQSKPHHSHSQSKQRQPQSVPSSALDDSESNHEDEDSHLVNGDSVQFEYNENSGIDAGGNKKKKKKKKKASQTNQHVIGHDLNLDDPELEYPDSRILKQDANGDVIVQPLNPTTVAPVLSAPASTSGSIRTNDNEKSRRKSSSLKNEKSLIPTDPLELNEELKKYWLSMPLEEKKKLLDLERESVFNIMKDQQRITCNCSVCGKKREIIEQELKKLYDEYSHSVETQNSITHSLFASPRPSTQNCHSHQDTHNHSSNHIHQHSGIQESKPIQKQQSPNTTNAAVQPHQQTEQSQIQQQQQQSAHKQPESEDPMFKEKTGLMSVAEDLLQNDGKKFLEMMEKLAESRIQRGQNLKQNSSKNTSNNVINSNQVDEEENSNYLNHGEDDDYDENDYVLKGASAIEDGDLNGPFDHHTTLPRDMIIPQRVPLEALCSEPNYKEEDDLDYIHSGSEDDYSDENYPAVDDDANELYQDLEGLNEDLSKPLTALGPNFLSEFQSKIERAVEILASDDFKPHQQAFLDGIDNIGNILNGKLQQEFGHEENEEFEDIFEHDEGNTNGGDQPEGLFNPSLRNTLIKRIEELSDGEYEVEQELDNGEPLVDNSDHEQKNADNEEEDDEDEYEEDDDEDDEGEDDEDEEEDEEEYENGQNDNEQNQPEAIDEEQQLEEGRAMLQMCTAKMLRQSLLEAYKKMKHEEYLQSFLMELEDEDEKQKAAKEKKQREKEKKKEKKRLIQEQKEKERLAKLAEQERIKKEKEEENRRKLEAGRKRREEEKRKKAEERRLRIEEMERNRKANEEKRKAEEEARKLEEEARKQKEEEQRRAKEEEERRIAEEQRLKAEEQRRKDEEARKVEELRIRELRRKEELINKSPFMKQNLPNTNQGISSTASPVPFYQNPLNNSSGFGTFGQPIGSSIVSPPAQPPFQQGSRSHSEALFTNSNNYFSQRSSEGSIPPHALSWANDSTLNNGTTAPFFNDLGNGGLARQLTPDTLPPSSGQSNTINPTPIDLITNGLATTHFDSSSHPVTHGQLNEMIDPFQNQGTTTNFGTSKLWDSPTSNSNGYNNVWNNTTATNTTNINNSSSFWSNTSTINANPLNQQMLPNSAASRGPPTGVIGQQPLFATQQPIMSQTIPSSAHSNTSNESENLNGLLADYQLSAYATYLNWQQYHSDGGFISLDQLYQLWINDYPVHSTFTPSLFRTILESNLGVVDFELLNDRTKSPASFVRVRQPMAPQFQINATNGIVPGIVPNGTHSQTPTPPRPTSQSLNGSLVSDILEPRSNSNTFSPWNSGF